MFSELRAKNPYLLDSIKMIRNYVEYAELHDLCKRLNAIQNDSRLGFSAVSFVRQAIALRITWLGGACVRGRLCIPPAHWDRNLIRHPPSAEELPDYLEQTFPDGTPWFFHMCSHEFAPEQACAYLLHITQSFALLGCTVCCTAAQLLLLGSCQIFVLLIVFSSFRFSFFVPIVHITHSPSVCPLSSQASALSSFLLPFFNFHILRLLRDRPYPPSIMILVEGCWVKRVFSYFQSAFLQLVGFLLVFRRSSASDLVQASCGGRSSDRNRGGPAPGRASTGYRFHAPRVHENN